MSNDDPRTLIIGSMSSFTPRNNETKNHRSTAPRLSGKNDKSIQISISLRWSQSDSSHSRMILNFFTFCLFPNISFRFISHYSRAFISPPPALRSHLSRHNKRENYNAEDKEDASSGARKWLERIKEIKIYGVYFVASPLAALVSLSRDRRCN